MNAMVGEWLDVGSVDDVPRRGARIIATGQGAIAVFKASSGSSNMLASTPFSASTLLGSAR